MDSSLTQDSADASSGACCCRSSASHSSSSCRCAAATSSASARAHQRSHASRHARTRRRPLARHERLCSDAGRRPTKSARTFAHLLARCVKVLGQLLHLCHHLVVQAHDHAAPPQPVDVLPEAPAGARLDARGGLLLAGGCVLPILSVRAGARLWREQWADRLVQRRDVVRERGLRVEGGRGAGRREGRVAAAPRRQRVAAAVVGRLVVHRRRGLRRVREVVRGSRRSARGQVRRVLAGERARRCVAVDAGAEPGVELGVLLERGLRCGGGDPRLAPPRCAITEINAGHDTVKRLVGHTKHSWRGAAFNSHRCARPCFLTLPLDHNLLDPFRHERA